MTAHTVLNVGLFKKRGAEPLTIVALIVLFFFVATHKLCEAPLWFDEGVEYWYSKVMFGPLPFNGDAAFNTTTMYERVVSTFQPPLYNLIMYVWLLVCDTEWWFRFFGVLMGFACIAGMYCTVRHVSGRIGAALTALLGIFTYQLCYYWQECAEYCLMLAFLGWTTYFFVRAYERLDIKSASLFALFCALPVWSQYGAAFIVIPMALVVLAHAVMQKNVQGVKILLVVYAVAALLFALPLYFFFMRVQLANGNSNAIKAGGQISIGIPLVADFIKSAAVVIKWLLFSYYSNIVLFLALAALVAVFIVAFAVGKSTIVRPLIVVLFASYAMYFVAVRLGFYSYGQIIGGWMNLGVRYALFFLPALICSIVVCVFLLARRVLEGFEERQKLVQGLCLGILSALVVCYCAVGWFGKIEQNWPKPDARSAVSDWYNMGGENMPTVVYYGADACASYYIRHNERYCPTTEDKVLYMDWNSNLSKEEYRSTFEEHLRGAKGELPAQAVFFVSHYTRDLDTMLEAFDDMGYSKELASAYSDVKLFLLNREGLVANE